MVEPDLPGFATLAVHAGVKPDPSTGAVTVPVYHSAGFVFEDTDHAAALFNLERPGHIYSRISNPTVAAFEERIAALEGGVGAVATASGQAALVLAITTLMGSGGHIVSSSALYGGTANLFRHTLPRFGIEVTFVSPDQPEAYEEAITDATRLVFAEIIGNPVMDVLDVDAVSNVAHRHGLPLLVDSTLASPYLCRPFEFDADLVLHSATKFLSGHGTVIGGVLVDSGRFDWLASGRFPTLTEPYLPYSGVVFTDEFGPGAFIARARAEGLRDFGACMSPETAFFLIMGIESLAARMDRHVANTRLVVEFLAQAPEVAWVRYPEQADHPHHDLAKRQFPLGAGAVLAFAVKGGREAGKRLIESVQLVSHLANLGDARTLIIHPASTTHRQLDPEALAAAGIEEGLVRLSVGLEDPVDIITDLARALRNSQKE